MTSELNHYEQEKIAYQYFTPEMLKAVELTEIIPYDKEKGWKSFAKKWDPYREEYLQQYGITLPEGIKTGFKREFLFNGVKIIGMIGAFKKQERDGLPENELNNFVDLLNRHVEETRIDHVGYAQEFGGRTGKEILEEDGISANSSLKVSRGIFIGMREFILENLQDPATE